MGPSPVTKAEGARDGCGGGDGEGWRRGCGWSKILWQILRQKGERTENAGYCRMKLVSDSFIAQYYVFSVPSLKWSSLQYNEIRYLFK